MSYSSVDVEADSVSGVVGLCKYLLVTGTGLVRRMNDSGRDHNLKHERNCEQCEIILMTKLASFVRN